MAGSSTAGVHVFSSCVSLQDGVFGAKALRRSQDEDNE